MRVVTRVTVALAVVLAVATAYPAWRSIRWVTTYGASSPAAMVAQFTAGVALIVAAALWTLDRPESRVALVLALASMAWFLPVWVGWHNGPPGVRTAAMLLAPLFLPLMCDIVISVCAAEKRSRTAVATLYIFTAALAFSQLLVTDPLADQSCWNNCTVNLLLLSSQLSLARALAGTWIAISVAIGLALTVGSLWHFAAASRTARRLTWSVTIPSSVLGLAVMLHGVAVATSPPENPASPLFAAIFHLEAWSVVALAAGAANGILRARWARRTATNLAAQLGAAPAPGSLESVLSRTTGDPTLKVAYWLPEYRRFVNQSGHEVKPPRTDAGRHIAQIVRQGELVAVIDHDAAIVDPDGLVGAIGPAARLAIDNERLQAELLAQLDDLRASRTRIVQTGDMERRRLERNLHDAAQQSVLTLSYQLRLAQSFASNSGVQDLDAVLQRATSTAQSAVDELRGLAEGIYPAVLSESGLRPALLSLADTAPIRVEVAAVTRSRLDPIVERTAYLAAADFIQQTADAGFDELTVSCVRTGANLVVEIRGADIAPTQALVDRVGAVDGKILLTSDTIRVVIPCG